jgi:hypothetical protein
MKAGRFFTGLSQRFLRRRVRPVEHQGSIEILQKHFQLQIIFFGHFMERFKKSITAKTHARKKIEI